MIQIDHATKTYREKKLEVKALQDVSIHVEKGDIYGIVGFSGAGKSTLIRLVNKLETPDSGTITVAGCRLAGMKGKELHSLRRRIGMVFQQFNLLEGKTVYHNIAIPLLLEHRPKAEIDKRVREVLTFVELTDKRDAYVSQLSGGQKQRVGIARALATSPDILLCDEATSALDPDATEAILALLKDLNRKLGITIVIITHEMAVIKAIAHRVTVMEEGRVVEEGSIYDIFSAPKAPITRKFIASASPLGKIDKLMAKDSALVRVKPGELLVKLTFQKECASEHVLTTAARRFGFDLNVVLANMEYLHGNPLGGMIGILSGEAHNIENGIQFLSENHVTTEVLKDGSID